MELEGPDIPLSGEPSSVSTYGAYVTIAKKMWEDPKYRKRVEDNLLSTVVQMALKVGYSTVGMPTIHRHDFYDLIETEHGVVTMPVDSSEAPLVKIWAQVGVVPYTEGELDAPSA